MGCGASAEKKGGPEPEEKTVSADAPKPKETDPAKELEKKEDNQGYAKGEAVEAGLNIVGAAATGGGGAIGAAGNFLASGFFSAADAVTFGGFDLDDMADDYYDTAVEYKDNVVAEWKSLTASNEYFNSAASNANPDWMKDLPDNIPYNELYIPGTHDTMAMYGGDLAECQSMTLLEQLNSGVRAFDIRCKHDCDSLLCFHGIIEQKTNFPEHVANVFEDFLEAHPGEAIIIRLKREGKSCGEHKCSYNDLVAECTKKKERWNAKLYQFPTLGELRGKVHFLAIGSPVKLYAQKIVLQDKWDTGDEEVKMKAIRDHAMEDRKPGEIHLSFTSATGMDGMVCYKAPGALAWQINKLVHDEIETFKPGVYMMDFIGVGTIEKMIKKNVEIKK